MSDRRQRMARVAEIASEQETLARARWAEAQRRVQAVDQQRSDSLDAAGRLAEVELPIGLRSHLVCSGARHLVALGDERVELAEVATQHQAELEEAAVKVRSLGRLIDRIDDADREHQQRVASADMQDAMTIRAARDAS